MSVRNISNNNFVIERPRQGWAYFEDTNQWRRTPDPWGAPRDHFPNKYGGWVAVSKPKDWLPPGGTIAGESLLGAGGASLKLFAPEGDAGGGHTKIGAGHKPQGYDEHGRYTGPGGGSVSMDGGPVRLYADEAGGEPGAAEPEAEGEAGQEAAEEVSRELEGILIADSGQIASDAGGGLSSGNEVRGPVTPPKAEVTYKNDDQRNPDPKPEELKPQMRETMENIQRNTQALDSININSGKREGETGPHAEGRAVDINKVNGIPVRDLEKAQGQDGDRARQAAKNMEEQAKKDPNVNQVIGPDGGWNKVGHDKVEPIPPKENKELLDRHKDHYHINVYRR